MNIQPRSSPVLSIACVAATLAGIAMNVQLASWDINEKILGPVVWLSIGLMFLGFLPGVKKWKFGQSATVIASACVGLYVAHGLWQLFIFSSM